MESTLAKWLSPPFPPYYMSPIMPTSSTDTYALLETATRRDDLSQWLGRCTTLREKKRTTDFVIP